MKSKTIYAAWGAGQRDGIPARTLEPVADDENPVTRRPRLG
jgi:hypothetical protein